MPSSNEINKQNASLNEQRDLLSEVDTIFENVVKSAEDMTDNLAGVADLMKQIVGDAKEIPDNLDDGNKNTNKFTQLLQKAKGKTKDLAKGLVSAAKTVADTMVSALGEIGGILSSVLSFSIVGTITSILGLALSKFEFAFKEVVSELGIGFNAVGKNVNKTFESMRGDIVKAGLEFKEVIGGATDLANNFGMAVSEAQKFSFQIADGAKALGVQTKTMSTIVGQFQLIGDLTTEQAHNLSEHVGIIAAQNDILPSAVLEDMAGSTEDMAIFSKGGVKNFAKTAIQARKLGMSVKDVANSLKGMLNFEDSLNKEMTASVMLGKNINLNEARRLAFAGDTAGAFEAIASELGDVDLGSLDPLTLQSVADAAGMSTEQLMKMSKGAEDMSGIDMGEEAMSEQERAALSARETLSKMEQVLADASEMANQLADALGPALLAVLQKVVSLLTQYLPTIKEWAKGFASWVSELMKMSWKDIGKEIGNLLIEGIKIAGKLLYGVGVAFGESLVGGITKITGVAALAFPKVFDKAFKKINKIMRNFKARWLKLVVRPIKNATRPFKTFMKMFKGSKGFGVISSIFKGIGKAIKLVLTPIRMLLKPFKAIFNTAKLVLKPLKMFATLFGKIGLKGIPVVGQIMSLIDGLRGGFNRLKDGAGIVENTFRFLGGFIEGVVDGIILALTGIVDWFFGTDLTAAYESLKTGLVNTFSNIGTTIVDFFKAIPEKIGELFSGLGGIIGGLITTGIESIGNLGSLIANLFTGAGDLIISGLAIGKEFFVGLFSTAIEGAKAIPGMLADAFVGMGDLIYTKIKGAFSKVGSFFSGIGQTIANMFPDIDFGAIISDMTSGVRSAMAGIKGLFTYPINKLIDTINAVKNAISNRTLFEGKTLLSQGSLIGPGDWGHGVTGDIPWGDIAIPKITTPNLGANFAKLHMGGEVKSDGLVEAKKGEVYAGAGAQAFKPIAEQQKATNRLLFEQNKLLMEILRNGIPVTKA